MDAFGYYRVTGLLRKNNLGLRAGPSTFVDGFFVLNRQNINEHILLVFKYYCLNINSDNLEIDNGHVV